MRKTGFWFWTSLVFTLVSCGRLEESSRTMPDVNVVLVTLDTTRPDYLSCYGSSKASTPALDQLARRGVLFSDAVVHCPLTLPSHGSILTGTYSQTHGIRDNLGFRLASGVMTIGWFATLAGQETAAFVGAAILSRKYGLNAGFGIYNDDMRAERKFDKLAGVFPEVRGELVSQRAIEWLDARADRGAGTPEGGRFFLWLHFYDPHAPYDPPEPYRSRHPKDLYAGEIEYTDAQVGRVLDRIKQRGLEDQTLVIVTADHGESLGEHGEYGHGIFLYDSTLRVPLIVAGPGVLRGRAFTQQVRSIDIFPTVAEYLGVPQKQAQGVSLVPLLTSGRPVRNAYSYMETLYPRSGMGWSELRGVRDGEWKLVVGPKPDLYHLSEDKLETRNLHEDYPSEVERLQKRVWEVAGDPSSLGVITGGQVDDQTRRELESLGYVNVNRRLRIRVDMSGPDPKDRLDVLRAFETAWEMQLKGDYAGAIPLLITALRSDPSNPTVLQKLATSYRRTGQIREAIRTLERAVAKRAETDMTHAELGEMYLSIGDRERAILSMERATVVDGANLLNLSSLARCYFEARRFADARKAAHAVTSQFDSHPAANTVLGLLALEEGDWKGAKLAFDRAVEGDESFADAYLGLGRLAEVTGEPGIAIRCYRQFLQRLPPERNKEIVAVKARLEQLDRGHLPGNVAKPSPSEK